MDIEVTTKFIFQLMIGSFVTPIANAKDIPVASYSQQVIFKNWILSRCLAKAYVSEEARNDAQISASAYLEFGKAPIEMYEKADALVEQYLAKKYEGSVKGEFKTMKCIDLFHSKEVERLAKKAGSAATRKKTD